MRIHHQVVVFDHNSLVIHFILALVLLTTDKLLSVHRVNKMLLLLAVEVINPDLGTVHAIILLNLQVQSHLGIDVDHVLWVLVDDKVIIINVLDDLNWLLVILLSVLFLGLGAARPPSMCTVHLRLDAMVHRKVVDTIIITSVLMTLVVGEVLRITIGSLIAVTSAKSALWLVLLHLLADFLVLFVVIYYNLLLFIVF